MPKIELQKNKPIVMSIGGSLVAPEGGPDVKFIKKFVELIKGEIKTGKKFVIVIGGGQVARDYQVALSKIKKPTSVELDWMGIYGTYLNAHLLRIVFGKLADGKKLRIEGGLKPGRSSDYAATMIAKKLGSKIIINGSNIDYIYDADPRIKKDAKPISEMSWKDYRKIIAGKWTPGMSAPFDPIASKLCQKEKISVAFSSGSIANIKKVIRGENFKGSLLK